MGTVTARCNQTQNTLSQSVPQRCHCLLCLFRDRTPQQETKFCSLRLCAGVRRLAMASSPLTPPLIWAQRYGKIFVTCEIKNAAKKEETEMVTFSPGLLSLVFKAGDQEYKLENLSLWGEINPGDSKYFANDRNIVIVLKKEKEEWWDGFTKDKSYKRFIKTDFSKFCEEDDKEYMGEFVMPDDGGMGMGSMGGMGGMGDMGGMGMDFDDGDFEDDDLSNLDSADGPPPLEGGDAEDEKPPPLTSE